MCNNIESFVFIDIETTGLPWQERNRTKITEICLISVSRRDLVTNCGNSPPISKLSLFFNPRKAIHPEATRLSGLSNDLLRYAPTFEEKIGTINSFLEELQKPVCLIAHNGNKFDYKIILAEFNDANASPPQHLFCVDSLIGFREIFKFGLTPHIYMDKKHVNKETEYNNILTDDEDASENEDWPELNVSAEDWVDIDELTAQLSEVVLHKSNANNIKLSANGYNLSALYKRILNKEAVNAHRAENDCLMLLECVTATKNVFIPWANRSCIKLTNIQPIVRY
ncbi:hypothetical protein ACJJTC_000194 [Scirpophaga incertulas]